VMLSNDFTWMTDTMLLKKDSQSTMK
jgi:hypothetical protein